MYNKWTDNEVQALLGFLHKTISRGNGKQGTATRRSAQSYSHPPDLYNLPLSLGNGGNVENNGP